MNRAFTRRTFLEGAIAAAATVLVAAGCHPTQSRARVPGQQRTMEDTNTPEADCQVAISLGAAFLRSEFPDAAEWKLVSAVNKLQGADADPNVWRLGYKRKALIPKQADAEIGKGGDTYLEVDVKTRAARRARGGH